MKKFKNIDFKNWNIRRLIYLIGGFWMIMQSFFDKTWWIAIFGLYFLSMAIFQFGCASGNCAVEPKKN